MCGKVMVVYLGEVTGYRGKGGKRGEGGVWGTQLTFELNKTVEYPILTRSRTPWRCTPRS